jgi:hypothetical protein
VAPDILDWVMELFSHLCGGNVLLCSSVVFSSVSHVACTPDSDEGVRLIAVENCIQFAKHVPGAINEAQVLLLSGARLSCQ